MRTMTSAQWRAAVKADPAPRKPRSMSSKEYRAIQGAEEVLEPRPAKPGETRTIRLSTRLISEANARDHWTAVARRKKRQRAAVRAAWMLLGLPVGSRPSWVVITRRGPAVMDQDNLWGSAKAAIDEIAKLCGIDDKPDPRTNWRVDQELAKTHGVVVIVMWP